jgi:G:T/U-mismatch repair DNA glycosylase
LSNRKIILYCDESPPGDSAGREIETIFFTSRFVEKIFKRFFPEVIHTIALPSPSPRYARLSLKQKAAIYKKHLPL